MRARGSLVCLVCAAWAVLAAPSAGAAARVGGEGFHLQVSLPESNGYSMSISAEGHRRVGLLAVKGGVSVAYTVKGRASSRRLDADFGGLGRVHIRFHLKPEDFPPLFFRGRSCKPSPLSFFGGRFHGEVDFAGEPEVAGVTAHSGPVALALYRTRVCKHRHRSRTGRARARSSGRREPLREVDLFAAEARAEGRTVSLGLIRVAETGLGSPETLYHVSVAETLTRVWIVRSAADSTPTRKKVLRLGRRGAEPATAAIALPTPFSGSASYSAEPGSASWSGDLSVSLPGVGAVPLTGAGFSAGLCRSFSSGDEGDCTGSLSDLSPSEVGEFGR